MKMYLFKRILIALPFVLVLSSFSLNKQDNIFDTKLRITVLDDLGNPIEGANVTLYGSEEDYKASENAIDKPHTTDDRGRTTFEELEAKMYWVYAEKGNKNNNMMGVHTDTLKENRTNKVNIVIQ